MDAPPPPTDAPPLADAFQRWFQRAQLAERRRGKLPSTVDYPAPSTQTRPNGTPSAQG